MLLYIYNIYLKGPIVHPQKPATRVLPVVSALSTGNRHDNLYNGVSNYVSAPNCSLHYMDPLYGSQNSYCRTPEFFVLPFQITVTALVYTKAFKWRFALGMKVLYVIRYIGALKQVHIFSQ